MAHLKFACVVQLRRHAHPGQHGKGSPEIPQHVAPTGGDDPGNRSRQRQPLAGSARHVGETEEGANEHIDELARLYLGVDKYPFHQEATYACSSRSRRCASRPWSPRCRISTRRPDPLCCIAPTAQSRVSYHTDPVPSGSDPCYVSAVSAIPYSRERGFSPLAHHFTVRFAPVSFTRISPTSPRDFAMHCFDSKLGFGP